MWAVAEPNIAVTRCVALGSSEHQSFVRNGESVCRLQQSINGILLRQRYVASLRAPRYVHTFCDPCADCYTNAGFVEDICISLVLREKKAHGRGHYKMTRTKTRPP